ncbi:NTP pyrophosphohydrolase [Microbacterium sp. cx-55]|uniref:NTP pyrophosphohydrolase n=1 Tax=unclassified Microbacterium TaxID=2609290 RepID=UPI001CBF9853|nr:MULTISPECIES: NTP pyrophosphohydrolase [unclassified Microbacterium]MBZ4487518.1 NTP pyrophosphohydrolase [Microbacterium sp. cx-55]MCC4908344.1 NTP pyrophosphohydrolase [Microbacterium sp. cx-59]UGB35538.1 NTP pyrophosphohydrolase [Microbacterium sp. cx-55]
MSAPATVGVRGHTDPGVTPDSTVLPGRTVVADRAIHAVCAHTAAVAIGVARREVKVTVGTTGGGLALRIEAPLPVPSLTDSAAIAAGSDLLERVRVIQRSIHERVAEIAGRTVSRVDVVVTGATVQKEKRVR